MNRRIINGDKEFKEILQKIRKERIKLGTDNIYQSDRRLTKAIARYINTDLNSYMTLVKSPLDDDNKKRGRRLKLR